MKNGKDLETGEAKEDENLDKANISLTPREMAFVFSACLLSMLLAALDQTIGMSPHSIK